MEEIWKRINNTRYEVSNIGNVRSNENGVIKPLSLVKNQTKKPYYRVGLSKNGVRTFYLVHRLVAEAFIPNPLNKQCVNHINENKQDNRVDNLEWCTNKENIRHSNKRTIYQIKDSAIVCVWPSLYSIKDFGGYTISAVCDCINGKKKIHKGFQWVSG